MLTPWGFSLSLRLTQCEHPNIAAREITAPPHLLPPTPPYWFQNWEIFSQSSRLLFELYLWNMKNIVSWWCKIFSLLSAQSVGGDNCSLGVIITVSERCKCCLITTPGLRSSPPSQTSQLHQYLLQSIHLPRNSPGGGFIVFNCKNVWMFQLLCKETL